LAELTLLIAIALSVVLQRVQLGVRMFGGLWPAVRGHPELMWVMRVWSFKIK